MALDPGGCEFQLGKDRWNRRFELHYRQQLRCPMATGPSRICFFLNGVEFTGAAENNMQPGGARRGTPSGSKPIREFNVLRDTYGAEYGKQSGRAGRHRDPVRQPTSGMALPTNSCVTMRSIPRIISTGARRRPSSVTSSEPPSVGRSRRTKPSSSSITKD